MHPKWAERVSEFSKTGKIFLHNGDFSPYFGYTAEYRIGENKKMKGGNFGAYLRTKCVWITLWQVTGSVKQPGQPLRAAAACRRADSCLQLECHWQDGLCFSTRPRL